MLRRILAGMFNLDLMKAFGVIEVACCQRRRTRIESGEVAKAIRGLRAQRYHHSERQRQRERRADSEQNGGFHLNYRSTRCVSSKRDRLGCFSHGQHVGPGHCARPGRLKVRPFPQIRKEHYGVIHLAGRIAGRYSKLRPPTVAVTTEINRSCGELSPFVRNAR